MRTSAGLTSYNPSAASAEVRDVFAGGNCTATAVTMNNGQQAIRVSFTGHASTAVGNQMMLQVVAADPNF
jgi:hypothetical protein